MISPYSSPNERIGAPFQRTSPLSGINNPQRMRNRLVFPLPFAPVSCRKSPGFNTKLTLLKSRRPPRAQLRFLTSRIGGSPTYWDSARHCRKLSREKHFESASEDTKELLRAVRFVLSSSSS